MMPVALLLTAAIYRTTSTAALALPKTISVPCTPPSKPCSRARLHPTDHAASAMTASARS